MSEAGPTEQRLRPVGVRILSAVIWFLGAGYLGWLAVEEPGALPGAVPAVALVAAVAYVAFWRPMVVVRDDAVEVRNLVRDVTVPFARLEAVTTRYSLTLHADEREFVSWSSPAPGVVLGRPRTMDAKSADALTGGQSERGVSRASVSVGTPSGTAAFLVQNAWDRYLINPTRRSEREAPPPVVTRTVWWVPALIGGLGLLTAFSLFW